jgi:hypothetical protein
MKRTTVTFYDEIYQNLESRAQEKGLQSIAQCVRELVDLGMKIEKAAFKSNEKEEGMDVLQAILELKNLLKNNLNWSLETRLLTRFLVENHPDSNKEKKVEILEKYKESANNHVKELVGDEDE